MHIALAIILFLAGLAIGALVGYFATADPPADYMELIPEVERVAAALPASEGEERTRLCGEFRRLVAGLKEKGAPKSIVDAGLADLQTHCPE